MSFIEKQRINFLLPMILSLLINWGMIELVPYLYVHHGITSLPGKKRQKTFKIRKITRKELKKIRTVGVKNGKKTFSKKLPKGNQPRKKKKLSITSLKPIVKPSTKIVKIKDFDFSKISGSVKKRLSFSGIETTTKYVRKEHRISETYLNHLSLSPDNAKVLRKSGLNISFDPPEGVKLDELNSLEKIYYSFQKRTWEVYVQSFLQTYERLSLEKPRIKRRFDNEMHVMSGKILFDKDGNIISIKIIRSSTDDDLHELFEETLKKINSLPNPPKDLVEREGNFTIYYQLKIGS